MLVVDREVQDDEQVSLVGVLVDLRPLASRENVLEVERMPAEALGDLRLLERGGVEVNPGQAVGVEFLDARLRTCARTSPRSSGAAFA